MTRALELAREYWRECYLRDESMEAGGVLKGISDLAALLERYAAEEREACAAMFDFHGDPANGPDQWYGHEAAAAIRARTALGGERGKG